MALRSTFRDPAGDVAYQRQLRDRYADEPVPPVPHLDVGRAIVRPISRKLAQQIILKYEWLGTMVSTSYHFGIFYGAYCAGAACVGSGVTGGINAPKEFGLRSGELLTLARGACVHWAPAHTNSKLTAWTTRLLARQRAGKLVIAYADTDGGEIGTVYQAAGWTYVGRGMASIVQFIAPNGRIYDAKIVYSTRLQAGKLDSVTWSEQRDAMVANGWRTQSINPKHRYVYILDRADRRLVERVEQLRQPYPKRAQHTGDALVVQTRESGSTPTRTLRLDGDA